MFKHSHVFFVVPGAPPFSSPIMGQSSQQVVTFFNRFTCFAIVGLLTTIIFNLPLKDSHRSWLFDRNNADFQCHASPEAKDKNIASNVILSDEEMEAFQRDGIIVLRNVISKDWLCSYRQLLMHVFNNPSKWDVLYSRMVANFYGAQKSIFLHQSSHCGRYLGAKSPAADIAAGLFAHLQQSTMQDIRMRVIEPTEALLNFEDSDGHTSWHTDDLYMHHKEDDDDNGTHQTDIVVIRIWIPLMDLSPKDFTFLAMNNSMISRMERREHNVEIKGTHFAKYDQQSSGVTRRHIIGPGVNGYSAGDAVIFAGNTPHFAKGVNCSRVGCARLIFSYALDGKALYERNKMTSLLPLYSGQEHLKPLKGNQFPLIYPEPDTQDWKDKLRPTYGDVQKSMFHATHAGLSSFQGLDLKKAMPYFQRVTDAFAKNVWVKPHLDLDSGERIYKEHTSVEM